MKAIILAGGKGTRLKPLTDTLPKPLVPIIDKPVVVHIIELLKKHGIYEIALTLGYKSELIQKALGDGSEWGVSLTYFIEEEPLGTAGSVKQALKFLSEDFIVISGDSYTDANITDIIKYHYEKRSIFTVVATKIKDPIGFGVLDVNEQGKITKFLEKPTVKGVQLVNTGIYVVNKAVMLLVPNGFYDFGKQLLPKLVGNLFAYITNDYWSDIGTLPSYYYTNYLVACDLAE